MKTKGKDRLPVTLLNGEVVKSGEYPTLEEISEYTRVVFVDQKQEYNPSQLELTP